MFCDTNILIAFLNGEQEVAVALSRFQQERRAIFISVITVTELLAHPALTKIEKERIESLLSFFTVTAFDVGIARHAGFFKRTYGLSFQDAALVASAYDRQMPLITRDKQLFRVKEVVVRSL